jgi:hypothetical protein
MVGVVEFAQRAQALVEGGAAVVGADDHGDARRPRQQVGGRAVERFAQRVVGGLGGAVGGGDAEGPVGDGVAAGVPVVGPGEDERPRQTHKGRLLDVAGQEARLRLLAVAERVHADLAQQ